MLVYKALRNMLQGKPGVCALCCAIESVNAVTNASLRYSALMRLCTVQGIYKRYTHEGSLHLNPLPGSKEIVEDNTPPYHLVINDRLKRWAMNRFFVQQASRTLTALGYRLAPIWWRCFARHRLVKLMQ
jgi:hypothetical protein